MKQEKNIETKAKSQNRCSIKDAFPGQFKFYTRVTSNYEIPQITPPLEGQGGGFTIGKGPPGRARSPDMDCSRNPDNKAGPKGSLTSINKVFHQFNKYRYSNFLQLLIFKIMKKQILILVMASFAISISTAYGQLVPRAITCLQADALHPVAGTPYTYKVDVPNPSGNKTYQWLVTQDKNFIVANVLTTNKETPITSAFLAAAGATYNVPTTITGAAAVSDQISLTWKSFAYDAAAPVFVVVNVINADGTCSPNNLKVYRIEPVNAFTLDIANINQIGTTLAYDASNTECISPIISATYNPAATGSVTYDFGTDTLYYEVTAANWSTSWNLSVQLTGLDPEETVAVQWATDKAFTAANAMTGSAVGTGAVATVYTSAVDVVPTYAANTASGTVGALGESIFIRVLLDHSNGTLNYEGLTPETIALAVDGKTMLTATPKMGDVHYANGGTAPACNPLVEDGFTNDVANQTLAPRPDVTAAVPATSPAPGLLPVNP